VDQSYHYCCLSPCCLNESAWRGVAWRCVSSRRVPIRNCLPVCLSVCLLARSLARWAARCNCRAVPHSLPSRGSLGHLHCRLKVGRSHRDSARCCCSSYDCSVGVGVVGVVGVGVQCSVLITSTVLNQSFWVATERKSCGLRITCSVFARSLVLAFSLTPPPPPCASFAPSLPVVFVFAVFAAFAVFPFPFGFSYS